jgi:hypothetical protein
MPDALSPRPTAVRSAARHLGRAFLVAVVAPLALAACTASTKPATSEPNPATPTSTATAASSTGTAAGGSQAASCKAQDVKVEMMMQAQRSTPTTLMALLQVTNKSAQACRMVGWATVALWNAANRPVDVPSGNVLEPSGPTPIDLAPGSTASAGVRWTFCDKGKADCPAGNTLKVRLPGDTTDVIAKLTDFVGTDGNNITMAGLQIGTLQPSAQGVVAW